MNRLQSLPLSSFLSGGIVSHGSLDTYIAKEVQQVLRLGLNRLFGPKPDLSPYINESARRESNLPFASRPDGQVQHLARGNKLLERALLQTTHQITYGYLRSYPRYLRYFEQKFRDKYLESESQTSIANKEGQYYKLISEQKAVAEEKNHTDTIVGHIVQDYLELNVPQTGQYFDQKTGQLEDNKTFGASLFVDLQPQVQVSSKNNVVLTTVQGRDYTRKELVSGGDYEVTVNGKITSKYPDVYPEAEISKFLKLMQYRGVLSCENTILRQFNITRFIVLNYSLGTPEYRNIQPYSLTCVAVEPSEAVSIKVADAEEVDKAVKHTNKWLRIARLGAQTIDPSSLLKFSPWV